MNHEDIDFTRVGGLLDSPEIVGPLVSLLTAARTTDSTRSLMDIEALIGLTADAEHAIASIFFLVSLITTFGEDLEHGGVNVGRFLQTVALRYQ